MLAGVCTSVADAQRLVMRHVGPATLLASGVMLPAAELAGRGPWLSWMAAHLHVLRCLQRD